MIKIPKTDLRVYPLCLGANVFGWSADEKESNAVLDAYESHGGNFIDTADVYSQWKPGNQFASGAVNRRKPPKYLQPTSQAGC